MSADNFGVVKRFDGGYYYGIFYGSCRCDPDSAGKESFPHGPFGAPMSAFRDAEQNNDFEYGVTFHDNCYPSDEDCFDHMPYLNRLHDEEIGTRFTDNLEKYGADAIKAILKHWHDYPPNDKDRLAGALPDRQA